MFQQSVFVPSPADFMAVGLQVRSSVLLRENPEQSIGNCGVDSRRDCAKTPSHQIDSFSLLFCQLFSNIDSTYKVPIIRMSLIGL